MSVRPVSTNADGSLEVVFDELGHSGTVPADQVVWVIGFDGNSDHNYLVLACPDGCGAVSTHPVGGGAAPLEVQQMFVTKTGQTGCACGATQPADDSAAPEAHVRLNCNRMDGLGRWQLEGQAQLEQRENSPTMFQVVYNRTTRLIVGLEPSGGVGPDNSVQPIHDLAEYDVLMATDPAYLSADGDHVVASPPS